MLMKVFHYLPLSNLSLRLSLAFATLKTFVASNRASIRSTGLFAGIQLRGVSRYRKSLSYLMYYRVTPVAMQEFGKSSLVLI